MLVSKGMANADEVAEALEYSDRAINRDILLFRSVSQSPAALESSNLGDIEY